MPQVKKYRPKVCTVCGRRPSLRGKRGNFAYYCPNWASAEHPPFYDPRETRWCENSTSARWFWDRMQRNIEASMKSASPPGHSPHQAPSGT